MSKNASSEPIDVVLDSAYQRAVEIHPCLPRIPWIFDLGPDVLIAAHGPHDRIEEHLHDHLPHMHIRYGFELPTQSFVGVTEVALDVAMLISNEHRVDCNPVFVARGNGAEGICLRIAGEDVHWVHNEGVAEKATRLFEATGRRTPDGFHFAGFRTSDLDERRERRYPVNDLKQVIGQGLRVDQHFQATWREPREEAIAPYPVTIYLGDDVTAYHTFFELRPIISLGVS